MRIVHSFWLVFLHVGSVDEGGEFSVQKISPFVELEMIIQ